MTNADQVFPTLTESQIQRIASQGSVHRFQPGEVLLEAGIVAPNFFVVRAGRIDIVRPSGTTERLIMALGPGSCRTASRSRLPTLRSSFAGAR